MAVYKKWQSERYSIGCKTWKARCPNCHYLVESTEHISSNYGFCPYCGFNMKSDTEVIALNKQYRECLIELKEAKRLLKAAVEDLNSINRALVGNDILCMEYIACEGCPFDGENCYEWRYTDEALKLIGDTDNGINKEEK